MSESLVLRPEFQRISYVRQPFIVVGDALDLKDFSRLV